MMFLDLLFPKKCIACKKIGSYICDNCFSYLTFDAKNTCLVCDRPSFDGLTHLRCKKRHGIDGCFSSISHNKTAQKLIYSFKQKPYLSSLKNILSDLFYEGLIQNENFIRELNKGKWIAIPVPLHKTKLRKRGYNQSEILAEELAKKFNFQTKSLLERVKNTKIQLGLDKKRRKENIKDAFKINTNYMLDAKNIFLVDDLATTGFTLNEAASVLKRAGVKKVIGLTLARD
ncbi:MAG: hypothetical protein A2W22_05725 [Candidatus Levybacteria bacterium RBG_16_35_11]|nr:MAG: hypothetical protein A2W22_05725 [Candidatus Levybacteria bacterium RBG_16_35_11]